jgi:hypothetical protein
MVMVLKVTDDEKKPEIKEPPTSDVDDMPESEDVVEDSDDDDDEDTDVDDDAEEDA